MRHQFQDYQGATWYVQAVSSFLSKVVDCSNIYANPFNVDSVTLGSGAPVLVAAYLTDARVVLKNKRGSISTPLSRSLCGASKPRVSLCPVQMPRLWMRSGRISRKHARDTIRGNRSRQHLSWPERGKVYHCLFFFTLLTFITLCHAINTNLFFFCNRSSPDNRVQRHKSTQQYNRYRVIDRPPPKDAKKEDKATPQPRLRYSVKSHVWQKHEPPPAMRQYKLKPWTPKPNSVDTPKQTPVTSPKSQSRKKCPDFPNQLMP